MKKPRTYHKQTISGALFSCRPYIDDIPLQFQKQWDDVQPNDIISVCVRSDKPSKGILTAIGMIETLTPVFIEYMDMTVSQYIGCCVKLYAGRMTLTDVITEFEKP